MTDVTLSHWQAAQRHEQNFWESYGETYERYPQILLDHLARLADAGEYIRDEPLGIGVLAMQAPGFRITAIDPLPRISFTIEDVVLDGYIQSLRERASYRCSPGEVLSFDDDFFDFVCCHNVIDHAHEPKAILEEIFRVLKSQCHLYLTLNTFSYLRRLKFEFLRKFNSEKMLFACHPHSFRHSDVLLILTSIGFEVVRHDGGHDPVLGLGCLSKFLCRKPI
jgi:SAM-dependent methyltransferase